MASRTCLRCREALPAGARFCPSCGAPTDTTASPTAPLSQRLAAALGPDYAVLGELGRGGFAVVFTARDHRLSRYLAVKVMRPELLTSPVARERFRLEAELAANLDHPNILSVAFAGEAAGLAYYAMPRVYGESLQRRLDRDTSLPIEMAQRIYNELAAGLAYAHAENIVHRDVKPANILIDKAGKALLVDFGIAKALSKDGGTLSFTGAVIGTPEYMSPEQAAGSRDIDHRTDIYGLGIVGFEMVTGKLPFSGKTLQDVAHKKATTTAPNARHFRPDVPAAFAASIARCLERDPARRWESAADATV